jgi:hypothetical protein
MVEVVMQEGVVESVERKVVKSCWGVPKKLKTEKSFLLKFSFFWYSEFIVEKVRKKYKRIQKLSNVKKKRNGKTETKNFIENEQNFCALNIFRFKFNSKFFFSNFNLFETVIEKSCCRNCIAKTNFTLNQKDSTSIRKKEKRDCFK